MEVNISFEDQKDSHPPPEKNTVVKSYVINAVIMKIQQDLKHSNDLEI